MNIGEAGQATRLPVKTLRYYEQIGLIQPLRQVNGFGATRIAKVMSLPPMPR